MIDLPLTPGPVSQEWQQVDFGGRLTPPLGGAVQRINRRGNRLMVTVTLPPMGLADAGKWVAALNRALSQGARWRVRQPGLPRPMLTTPVSDGAITATDQLAIRAGAAGTAFRAAQLVNVGAALHMVTAPVVVGGDGKAVLPLDPPLRFDPANGTAVQVVAPTIEGLLQGDGLTWSIDRARLYGLGFSIMEQA